MPKIFRATLLAAPAAVMVLLLAYHPYPLPPAFAVDTVGLDVLALLLGAAQLMAFLPWLRAYSAGPQPLA